MIFLIIGIALIFTICQMISMRYLLGSISSSNTLMTEEKGDTVLVINQVNKRFKKILLINIIDFEVMLSFFIVALIITPDINIISIIVPVIAFFLFTGFSYFVNTNTYNEVNRITGNSFTKAMKTPLIISSFLHGLSLSCLLFAILGIYL